MINEEVLYTKENVYSIIENAKAVRGIAYRLKPDHDLLLSLYDVERAVKLMSFRKIDFDYKTLFELWIEGVKVSYISEKLDVYNRKINREKWKLSEMIADFLNGV